MFKDNFRSNGTSGQNWKYHLLFVWPSPAITKRHNVSIWFTKEDTWFLVTLHRISLDLVYRLFILM
jgi:hypothetical protein